MRFVARIERIKFLRDESGDRVNNGRRNLADVTGDALPALREKREELLVGGRRAENFHFVEAFRDFGEAGAELVAEFLKSAESLREMTELALNESEVLVAPLLLEHVDGIRVDEAAEVFGGGDSFLAHLQVSIVSTLKKEPIAMSWNKG
jgi:hypothetical protein